MISPPSRRGYLQFAGVAGVASLTGCARSSSERLGTQRPTGSTDVPMFRYNPARIGGSPGTTSPTDSVIKQWAVQMDEGTANSLPVVDEAVYAWSNDRFYALATSDGTEQWTFETNKELGWSPPVVADGTAYVENSDGTAYALSERQLRCS